MEAIVNDFTSLKTAALDPTIDYIYLNADIMLASGGIGLPKDKPSLTIDGLYPNDGTGVIHTITDMNDLNQGNAIRVNLVSGSYHLTLKNCKFIGRNFYGAISCVNGGAQSTTLLTLENVEYSGPQAVYNRYGTVELIGGKYDIGQLNGTTAVTHELAEANKIIIAGNIKARHDGTANSCFYACEANPSFTLKANSSFDVEITGRELFYNDVVGMDFTIEANSRMYVNANWSMFYSAGMCANFVNIGEGAELVYEQRSARSAPTINCRGNFYAGPNSRVIIIKQNFSSTQPILQFQATATAEFDDPLAIVFYNANGRVINWSAGTGTIIINSEIINYWTVATAFPNAGTFNDIPLYNWFKADESNAQINATVSTSATTSVSTNLIQGVDAQVIPNTTSFNVQNARVLALGKLPLDAQQPKQNDINIVGVTLADASIHTDVDGAFHDTFADTYGMFSVLVMPIQKNDIVLVGANKDFKIKYLEFLAEGIIDFLEVPARLPFKRVAVPVRRMLFGRVNPDWAIIVRDSRDGGGNWSVYAHALAPLSSVTAQLPDALVYKDDDTIQSLEGVNSIKIYEGEGNTDPDYTDTVISWTDIEGLLMRLVPGTAYEGGHYETTINFSLEEE